MEEDEDRFLLSSLGVTSANPADIEQTIPDESAVNHDAIMNANDEAGKMRLEHQASQVAQRAAEALRQSRMLRSRESISVPTWTGRSGCAGAPSSVRRRFGSTVNSRLLQTTADKSSVVKNGISAVYLLAMHRLQQSFSTKSAEAKNKPLALALSRYSLHSRLLRVQAAE